jgi:hypothetical protein
MVSNICQNEIKKSSLIRKINLLTGLLGQSQERVTKVGLDAIDTSTPLESNKSDE